MAGRATSFSLAAAASAALLLISGETGSGFALEGPKWPGATVPMVVQLGTPNFVLPDGFLSWDAAAENAMAQWNEQHGGVQFTWTEAAPGTFNSNTDGKNTLQFSGSIFGSSYGQNVLAVTSYRSSGGVFIEADINFNTAISWSSGQSVPQGKDFHRVALHELGHVLGLDHPDEHGQHVSAMMNSMAGAYNALQDDDIAGVHALYGGPPTPPIGSRLANISTRALVSTGDSVLIAGFIIHDQTKQVLIRALGPTLESFGVSGVLNDPVVELHNGDGSIITTNDNWSDNQQAQIQQTGLAPPNNFESAILATLAPANYTAIVSGKGDTSGVGLAEVYDLQTQNGRAYNISTRGLVSGGDNVMIAGFIAQGPQLKSVVIRGLGPGLRGLGITNALADPTIEIHNSQGQLMQSNAGWQTDPTSQLYVQIFGLVPPNTSDSALYEQLGPGSYTVILRSASGATGVGLIEVYDVDQ